MPKEYPQQHCVVCGAGRFDVKYRLASSAIWRCRACGMMALWPQPDEVELRALYDAAYYKREPVEDPDAVPLGYVDYLGEKSLRRLDMERILRVVRPHLRIRQGERPTLLEIGSGLGFLMEAAHDAGFDVEGVELSRYAWRHMREAFDFPVHLGTVTDARCRRDQYDACFMLDVAEHLLSPRETLARVSQLVRPAGLLVVQTMDCGSLASRVLGQRQDDIRRIPEHLYFFNRATISRLLRQFGFDVISIRTAGRTLELGALLDRLDLNVPYVFRWLRKAIRPRRLLTRPTYFNPGTHMLVTARRRRSGQAHACW